MHKDYKEHIYDQLMKMPNGVPVLGGAYHAYDCMNSDNVDIQRFCEYLLSCVQSAIFFEFDGGIENALNTFCHLCLVDPMLIEAYLGIRFTDIAKHYEC